MLVRTYSPDQGLHLLARLSDGFGKGRLIEECDSPEKFGQKSFKEKHFF